MPRRDREAFAQAVLNAGNLKVRARERQNPGLSLTTCVGGSPVQVIVLSNSASSPLPALLQRFVSEGRYAGVSVLALRDGQPLHQVAAGFQEVESRRPMTVDSIVRIHSVTKVLTAVTALTFLEEGQIDLGEPVETYLPEVRSFQVIAGSPPEAPELRKPARPMTVRDLFRHTAGIAYPAPGTPTEPFFAEAGVSESVSLADKIRRIVRVPLVSDPGVQFDYGYGTDFLARVLEVVSGRPFEQLLSERVLEPAGMAETGFTVADPALDRLAMVHEGGGPGSPLRVIPMVAGERRPGAWRHPLGGSGLYSTLADLGRFGRILCAGGEFGGTRLLGRKTVDLMRANHLAGTASPYHSFDAGSGFGLGVGVRLELGLADRADSPGCFGWNGLASTFFRVDPAERLVLVVLIQHFPFDEHRLLGRIANVIYSQL
ncbi:MAG: beta-lactamase family protein [Verrucomicrobia bacterium]|nr:beta-lactamase family protein [Verrucomicrobiota bacterium]